MKGFTSSAGMRLGSNEMLRSFATVSGSVTISCTALSIRAAISGGVLAGTINTNQASSANWPRPASLNVGTSGSKGERESDAITSVLTLPALTCGAAIETSA